jgi:hypothetical protein
VVLESGERAASRAATCARTAQPYDVRLDNQRSLNLGHGASVCLSHAKRAGCAIRFGSSRCYAKPSVYVDIGGAVAYGFELHRMEEQRSHPNGNVGV